MQFVQAITNFFHGPAANPAIELISITYGQRTVRPLSSDDSILTIGRAASNSICVADDGCMSKAHARIIRTDGALFLEDLDSRNGTYVNGARITSKTPLKHGDKIFVGRTSFIVHQKGLASACEWRSGQLPGLA